MGGPLNNVSGSTGRVVLTVDALITDEQGRVLVMQRGTEPYKDSWVLPGGIVEAGETVEEAVMREVEEETGLHVRVIGLVGVYSEPGRDPRGSFVSVAFHVTPVSGQLRVSDEARAFRWSPAGEMVPMGFDHAHILADHRRGLGQ